MNIETIREKIKAGKYIISFTHTEKIRLDEILIVTAYEPDSKEWEADWKTRKEIKYGG